MNALIRTAAAAVLLFGALAANAKPAPAPTPQQRQAAQKLAGISVRILDLSRLFGYNSSEHSWYKQFQANMTAEEFRCFTTKMGTPQGFRAYKMDEALDYVQHRSPQDLQHHDLRQLMLSFAFDTAPVEDGVRSLERYVLWSLRECHISAEELRARARGGRGK